MDKSCKTFMLVNEQFLKILRVTASEHLGSYVGICYLSVKLDEKMGLKVITTEVYEREDILEYIVHSRFLASIAMQKK